MEKLCVVKRADTPMKKILGVVMIAIGILFAVAAILFGQPYFFLGTPIFIIIYVLNFNHAEISFDYTFFGSEFKIARIKGDNRRKLLHMINIENIRMITRADDPALYNAEHESGVIKRDYTSLTEGAKIYKMVFTDEGKTFVVSIEPSEDFLNDLAEAFPKIVTK
ncbi:MAG: hypothetical protein MJ110_05755 [Lachnospiraceae bacterium]|nr:hypothetical protein [Lachnospiraceae bacterium]